MSKIMTNENEHLKFRRVILDLIVLWTAVIVYEVIAEINEENEHYALLQELEQKVKDDPEVVQSRLCDEVIS